MKSTWLQDRCEACGGVKFADGKPSYWPGVADKFRKKARAWKELARRYRERLDEWEFDGCPACEDCCECIFRRKYRQPFFQDEPPRIPYRGKR